MNANRFGVVTDPNGFIYMLHPPKPYQTLSHAEALELAARLVKLADPADYRFGAILKEHRNQPEEM